MKFKVGDRVKDNEPPIWKGVVVGAFKIVTGFGKESVYHVLWDLDHTVHIDNVGDQNEYNVPETMLVPDTEPNDILKGLL